MTRTRILCGASGLAVTIALAASGQALAADAAPAQSSPTTVGEVVVTGSFIRGTPEDAALPVDVIGKDELEKQGVPSTVELIKALPVSNGVIGDTNQFDARAQGSEGSGSVNLRGLGPQRTLVLLNGKRLPINPLGLAGAGTVDTNALPAAAIGRVEVLKDGAAATYGSDAIGGVVNFITRKGFTGLETSATYRHIDGSDGDYSLAATWGHAADNVSTLWALSYLHRSKLSVAERDWANRPYLDNPEGGWSAAGNPLSYVPFSATLSPLAGVTRDVGCAPLGGQPGYSGAVTTPVCYWHYTPFDNLVEEENRVQLYGELNVDLSGKTKFHADMLVHWDKVPEWNTSPSYAALSTPTAEAEPLAALAGRYYVPGSNPGLIAYYAANGLGAPPAGGAQIVAFRPYALGGNPLFGYGPSIGEREFHEYRFSGGFTGEFENGIGWDVSATYGWETGRRTGYDSLVNRFELALRGLGGEGCNPATGTPGAGPCQYFNPFSNAIARNVITGQANPGYNSAVANSAALTAWFFKELETEQTARLFTTDAVLNGKLPWRLSGGDIGWAFGAQYRHTWFKADYNDISNALLNPCVNTPDYGVTNCTDAARNGPFMFLGVGTPGKLDSDVWSTFGELNLPVTDAFNVQAAARYEDYGGAVGSTFNPKVSARWQIVDAFAVRGSVGSTFRAPADTALSPNSVTSLQSILGVFRAVDIFGNPGLAPEKANTYTVGAIVKAGGFRATLDWWKFDFKNPIVAEPVAGLVGALFPTAGTGNCGVAAYAAIEARFTFAGACNSANISRLRTQNVNGPSITTSGVDLLWDWTLGDLWDGRVALGGSATYVKEYHTDAQSIGGVVVAPAFEAAGFLNYQTTAYPIPKWKGDVHAEFSRGAHNLRYTLHYLDSYVDQRTAPFAPSINYAVPPATTAATVSAGKTIEATWISDLTWRWSLPRETTFVLTVDNLFDRDPSFARLDLNYDPFTGDPLGRTYKVSLTKRW